MEKINLPKAYYQVCSSHYYIDYISSFALFLGSTFLMFKLSNSFGQLFCGLIAGLLAYRLSAFIHELNHFPQKLKTLSKLYHCSFGAWMFLGQDNYPDHHLHHQIDSFSTQRDGKYVLATQSHWLVRFLIRPLFALPRSYKDGVLRWREHRTWSLFFSLLVPVVFISFFGLKGFLFMFFIHFVVEFLDAIHLQCTHDYSLNCEAPKGVDSQLVSSKNICGGLSFLIMPIGLGYHRLHHFLPGIPYHNLASTDLYLRRNLNPGHLYFT